MASKFPHVEVIGIDLAPGILNQDEVPGNCRIELDDVNRGLQHFYGQIDLVHMRSVTSGVSALHQLAIHLLVIFSYPLFRVPTSQIQAVLNYSPSLGYKFR